MTKRRSFRPQADRLEDRALLSSLAGAEPPTAPVGDPGPIATSPTVGNDYMSLASWMDLHGGYAARARAGGDSVVFLGDSITYLWGDSGRGSVGSDAWESSFGPLGAANFGIMADQTQDVLWRVRNGELDGHPGVAVVLVGVNNLGHGQSPADTAAGIAAVVGAIRTESPSTKVLLLGLLPAQSEASDPLRAESRQVNATIAGLDDGHDVRFLDIGPRLLNPDGTRRAGLFLDGLHPSATGYRVFADAIAGPIRSLLGRISADVAAEPAPTTGQPFDAMGSAIGGGPIWIGVFDPPEATVARVGGAAESKRAGHA